MSMQGLGRRFLRQVRRRAVKLTLLLLAPVEALNARSYMRIAVPLLGSIGVRFRGVPRYISSRVYFDDYDLVTIGGRSVLSRDVVLLTHDYSVTTVLRAGGEAPVDGDVAAVQPITIGSNVFVGWGSILLPGTVIEDDVVVGAGSVVRGLVRRGSVVMGNPAGEVSTVQEQHEKVRARIVEGKKYRKDD